MKDLLEKIFKYLPTYVPELASVVGRPKTTIAARNTGKPEDFTKALLFVGVTVAIGFVLQAPLLRPEHDFVKVASAMVALKIVCILAYSGMLWFAWRLVGGAGAYMPTLVAYLYMISPIYLLGLVLQLVNRGIVRSYDPALADRMLERPGALYDDPATFEAFYTTAPGLAWAHVLTVLATAAAFIAWPTLCWGAFRQVHGISRLRSAGAWVLALAFLSAFLIIVNLLILGIFGAEAPPIM